MQSGIINSFLNSTKLFKWKSNYIFVNSLNCQWCGQNVIYLFSLFFFNKNIFTLTPQKQTILHIYHIYFLFYRIINILYHIILYKKMSFVILIYWFEKFIFWIKLSVTDVPNHIPAKNRIFKRKKIIQNNCSKWEKWGGIIKNEKNNNRRNLKCNQLGKYNYVYEIFVFWKLNF